MEHSASIYKLSLALCKAQKKFKTAIKKSVNPYFKSKYADYAEVLSCVKEPLNSEGISILQAIQGDFVETILLHESGEWISSQAKIICIPSFVKNKQDEIIHTFIKPQDYGSAVTYARRYGLASLLSIDSDEDDDGNIANGNIAGTIGGITHTPNVMQPKKDAKKEQDILILRQRILKLYQQNVTKEQIEKALGYSLTDITKAPIDEIKSKLDELEKSL